MFKEDNMPSQLGIIQIVFKFKIKKDCALQLFQIKSSLSEICDSVCNNFLANIVLVLAST